MTKKTEQDIIAEAIESFLPEAKDILSVHIHDDGKKIGEVSAEDFRKHMGVKSAFLEDLVKQYNSTEEKRGSKQRASIQTIKPKR